MSQMALVSMPQFQRRRFITVEDVTADQIQRIEEFYKKDLALYKKVFEVGRLE